MKLVEVLCVGAQHAGTQITTSLRSGAVQAAGKRHARQCHAQDLPPWAVSRLDWAGTLWVREEAQAGRHLTHSPSGRL